MRSRRGCSDAARVSGAVYRAELVEKGSYLLELVRYIALNPMRTDPPLSPAPEAYRWSSYPVALGLAPRPAWLDVDWVLSQFGRDYGHARAALNAFVDRGLAATAPQAVGGRGGLHPRENRRAEASGLLRELADQMLRRRAEHRAARLARIARAAGPHGGGVAELVKRHRPA